MTTKKEFGDFQTPDRLAVKVTELVNSLFGTPEVVIEPTAGLGAFLNASARRWGPKTQYLGYEINKTYVERARTGLEQFDAKIFHRDFFDEDWQKNILRSGKSRTLVIGNPPWVTNSDLGQLGSKNLPAKSNSQGLSGLDALTGKSNFDIAEWMLVQLIEALPSEGAVAMLCKTMTARKVLRHFWKTNSGRERSMLFRIDAKAEFDVAVDACLFYLTGKRTNQCTAIVYDDLDLESTSSKFGLVDGELVSDIDSYQKYKSFEGDSLKYLWRSGVKHDAAKVMEFTSDGKNLFNGFGDLVEIEEDYVFPLLKSSDLGNGRIEIRKAVLVTQKHTGDDTQIIEKQAPRTWAYLMRYKEILDARKSSIYRNRPSFSVFGIGPYSFTSWKVAISGFYQGLTFMVVPPCDGRPVMIDDTCYSIPCHSREEAELVCELLSSSESIAFLKSLVFADSKRPITIDVLRRISVIELARHHRKLKGLNKFAVPETEHGQAVLPPRARLGRPLCESESPTLPRAGE